MQTDTPNETNQLNKEELNLLDLIKKGLIRLKLSIDVFLVPLLVYKVSHLLHISNCSLHISLIVSILQLFLINDVFVCILFDSFILYYCRSFEIPIYTFICILIYVIFNCICYGKLKTSEVCIISQIITTLIYLDGRLGDADFALIFAHKLTLTVTSIVIAHCVFIYMFNSIITGGFISQFLWYPTFDWLLFKSNGIQPIRWIFNHIFSNIPLLAIWGGISLIFIFIMLLKLRFKESKCITSSLRKDVHFLLSSIVMVSLYLEKLQSIILALDGLLILFLLLEMIRHSIFPSITKKLQYIHVLYNERDSDDLLFIHFFILLGLTVPLITSLIIGKDGLFDKWILGSIGVYAIGLADSMACIFGMIVSSPKLPYSESKTACGSLAFFTVLFLSLSVASYLKGCLNVIEMAIIAFIATLYEAYNDSADNLTIPLVSTLVLLFLGDK